MIKVALEARNLKIDGETQMAIKRAKNSVTKEEKIYFTRKDLARSMWLAIYSQEWLATYSKFF